MSKPLKVFITYSHKNTAAKDELTTRLALLQSEGIIDIWHDNEILLGDKWRDAIFSNLADSDLLLYLTSVYSLESENCNKELATALNAEIRVILIILERCDWLNHQLSDFQALPDKGLPITKWEHESDGWQNVVDGIRKTINKLQSQADPSSGGISEEELRAELAFQHGNVLMMFGELYRAIEVYSGAIDLNPRHAFAYINRGAAYSKKGKYDLAIEDCNEAIRLHPDYALAYSNRGNAYNEKDEHDLAIADLRRAIELKPDYADAYNNRGNAYKAKSEYDLAIADYTKAIQLKPVFAEAYSNRGAAYGKKGEHNFAIADYHKAIQLNPNLAEAYNNRGVAYNSKGEVEHAIEDYDKAIQLNSKYAGAYNNRGIAYNSKGEVEHAIEDYDKAIQLNSKYAGAYNNRGIAYREKGDYERAIKDYNMVIKLKPDFTDAYYNRGIAYREKGDYDFAIQDSSKAIGLNPDFAEAYHNRGVAYGSKDDYNSAIVDYTKAIELKPDYAQVYYNRGNAYLSKDEHDLAIIDYTKAIELDPVFANSYINRGSAYSDKGDFDRAIEDYTKAIELDHNPADAYNNRGVVYGKKEETDRAIEDYTKAIELNPNLDITYYNRGVVWLHSQEWENAKADLTTAKKKGMDIIAAFRTGYKSVEAFEQRHLVKLPEDLALLLTQRRRSRYPKMRRVLDADGNPLESPNVVNLRSQLRNAGTPLAEYVKAKPAFGINTAPTEVFVVDRTTWDKLIAAHPSSVDILKPFLHGEDLRRWHVDTPQQWLIFTHRGIAINDYPAILKHLEKYREVLRKRKGKQKWYELPVSLGDAERFAQPKLVCPNTYNHQTFAVDTSGYYYGNTSYLIPTEEKWLCGLLNSRTVEWFYSQVSNQLTIDYLRARSGYIQQIPIPNLTPAQKTLIAKLVDYLIYLQQQPTTNSKDLKHARDAIMLGYFERIIDGLIYESYLPEDLHKGDKHFSQPLLDEQLPSCEEIQGDKMTVLRDIFELLYERTHLVRRNLYYLDSVKAVRIIEGKI